ncbi:MAG: uspA [Hyphomicrobiales bacterium]|nr:uspA [Hyphomicrobiales bacterium]
MAYASLLVHVEPDDPASDDRVALAADLASRFHAQLTGLCAITPVYLPPDDIAGVALARSILDEEERRAQKLFDAAQDRFRVAAAHEGVRLAWRSSIDDPEEAIARAALSADLIVLGRPSDVHRAPDPGEVLLMAGRPVLVAPPGVRTMPLRNVVVGWKDGREARRALWDALPILELADDVDVVEITDGHPALADTARMNEVVAYLHRHGVKAQGECRARGAGADADELARYAAERDADMIVVGGYAHSRLREWALGGVTKALIETSPRCCFLSH